MTRLLQGKTRNDLLDEETQQEKRHNNKINNKFLDYFGYEYAKKMK
jgi:hypothetical protein